MRHLIVLTVITLVLGVSPALSKKVAVNRTNWEVDGYKNVPEVHNTSQAAGPRSRTDQDRTITACYKIKCTGSSGTCFIFAVGPGMEVGIPGSLSMTKVPCSSFETLPDPVHADAIFIPTDGNPSLGGTGWTAVDADVAQSSGECNLTVYDDSPTYTSYAAWHAAH